MEYYPFGLNQNGDWYATIAPENKYQYNGKELNTDLGLNWIDYKRRYYDPAIARWGQIDPLAQAYSRWSPYHYTFNNPLIYIDPDGAIIEFGSKRAENLYNYVYENSSDELRKMFDKLDGSDVVYSIDLASEGGELGGAVGNTSLDYYDSADGFTQINIFVTDGKHDGDARYQIGALVDELTHAGQFEDGDIGYDAERGENAISYDYGDEVESRVNAVDATERCECEPASENALIADPTISKEDKLNLLRSRNYRFDNYEKREKVVDVLKNQTEVQKLKDRGVNRVIYRENGKTKHKDLN